MYESNAFFNYFNRLEEELLSLAHVKFNIWTGLSYYMFLS